MASLTTSSPARGEAALTFFSFFFFASPLAGEGRVRGVISMNDLTYVLDSVED